MAFFCYYKSVSNYVVCGYLDGATANFWWPNIKYRFERVHLEHLCMSSCTLAIVEMTSLKVPSGYITLKLG